MKLSVFKLESYFQKWEFEAPYQFCNSDMETIGLHDLLQMADPEGRSLWENMRLGYTEVTGIPILRDELSKLYTRIIPKQIMTCTGGEEGIYFTFHALLSEKDHVIVVTPCYQSHLSIPQAIGCEVSEVRLDFANSWKLDFEQIRKLVKPNTKMIVVNFPHNPTGTTLSRSELDELICIAKAKDIYILSDEAYRFSELESSNQMPPLADLYERAISIGVLSKAFGLAGIRVGWIATQDLNALEKMSYMKHYLSICGSAPSEVLGVIALRAKEKILERNHSILKTNLRLLDPFFMKYPDMIRWVRPTGSCAGFPELLLKDPIEKVTQDLVQEEGVLILPGSNYDWPGNFFRLGFGRKNMPESLSRFERFILRRRG